MTPPRKPSVILLDIEGTTTPISFVSEILFSYARMHLKQFLYEHADDEGIRRDLDQLLEENQAETSNGVPKISEAHSCTQAYDYLVWLMDEDRKSSALKSIQGRIWETGYASGQLKSTVFDDVPAAFGRWHDEGRRVAIYSSGSVLAQKLLFQHSQAGDLTRWIEAYFDTASGPKTDAASYSRIAQALGIEPKEILFLSDSPAELDAGASAGLDVRLAVRPGNRATHSSVQHLPVFSFDEL
ncbi:MAG TPA: acireductone synthase [Silvibacterium sp.]|nr:acireductone synthase [Silvibacterium sp.]